MNVFKDLQEKLSQHEPKEVDQLILDDLFSNITQFSEENKTEFEMYSNLIHLSLNGFGLCNLKNMPKLPNLEVLELRGNKLTGEDFKIIVESFPKLYKLKVGNNPIVSLDVLEVFKDSELKKIEIEDTTISKQEDFKIQLFAKLPKLEILNRLNQEGKEYSTTDYEDIDNDENSSELDEGSEEDDFEAEDCEDDDEEQID